ncbi:MAG TPA: asparagine synthase (glutamine-hydrolyzing) [Thermoanaerobaculia bacterium]|nr:asparagine synthase (glutamine-hydrolyzing) [Thermoanaerobaculia bacterium]
MCGIAAVAGPRATRAALAAMVARQRHRGPDGDGVWLDDHEPAGLGHDRLAILDLSLAGAQPMRSADGRYVIVFNGEVYNYLELRRELAGYPFTSATDTEVVLAAWERWGPDALDRFVGMFAFVLWDVWERRLVAARDRFGVKPLYYHEGPDGTLFLASEIKALFAAGVPARPDESTWATYLAYGLHDQGERTFWQGVRQLRAGHVLTLDHGLLRVEPWYDLTERTRELDTRPEATVIEEYRSLLLESVRLRFRSDVPVGIDLSGGLDSSLLLGLVQAVQGEESDVLAFTFVTGDPRYDELPWVSAMLERTRHPSVVCRLAPQDVPSLASSMQSFQDEPYGGLPTLAYGRLFEEARARGVVVLLDGQGIDEQWAGYDYYRSAADPSASIVQATKGNPARPDCLVSEFRALAVPLAPERPFPDALRNLQLRDAHATKLPRALRFNDRASMRASTELREPFLDHRLFELALRQPAERKVGPEGGKLLLRKIARTLIPDGIAEAPKRPLQTPQREWLRGPLARWAEEQVEAALERVGGAWLDADAVRGALRGYRERGGESSFFLWQWIGLGLTPLVAEAPEEALLA